MAIFFYHFQRDEVADAKQNKTNVFFCVCVCVYDSDKSQQRSYSFVSLAISLRDSHWLIIRLFL